MKKLNKKIIVSLVITTLMMLSLYAKDPFGIGLQFGAIGSKPTYPSLFGTSEDVPYTFNPDVHIDLNIPICDIDENSFFSINLGYDYSWEYLDFDYHYWSEGEDILFSTHRISLIPTFTFSKSNFRFFLGTGFSVDGISIFRKHKIGKVSFSESETIKPSLSWAVNAGFKYKLAKHLFFIADMSFFVNLIDNFNDDFYDGKFKLNNNDDIEDVDISGGATMEIFPKIGLMISF